MESASNEPCITYIVTGFGPFRGVSANPTETVVRQLIRYLESNPSFEHLSSITRVMLFETSVKAVTEKLEQIQDEINASGKEGALTTTVILHLGVNNHATMFQLERCAYNEASFRIPDEQGHQPQRERILHHNELASCLTTRLDIPQLVRLMNQTQSVPVTGVAPPASVVAMESTDPGRFVCNYTYYCSLDKFKSHAQCPEMSDCWSLFLHVPPETATPITKQLDFVARLMVAIHEQLSDRLMRGSR